jgi:SAM-dependent methyltransferase
VGARLLDLCCGTGQVARALAQRGFAITGLDGSEQMLCYARVNAPNAQLLRADVREFSLPNQFEAVTCLFDSLNHIMTPEDLTSVFRNVHAALQPGGCFLFDMNMDAGFRERWRWPDVIVYEDFVCASRPQYSAEDGLARSDFTLFCLKEGGWRRTDLTFSQRAYSEEELRQGLEQAGFGSMTIEDMKGRSAAGAVDRAVVLAERSA